MLKMIPSSVQLPVGELACALGPMRLHEQTWLLHALGELKEFVEHFLDFFSVTIAPEEPHEHMEELPVIAEAFT